MPIHVAILKRPYLRAILEGRKTIESRLYRVRQPPFQCIAQGERLFLKVSAGPWMATARAARVQMFDGLTPAGVDAIRRDLGHHIGGDDAYWSLKRGSRYAVLVHLADVEPLHVGPPYAKSMQAWHVLDEGLSPLREVVVTRGALNNGYAPFPAKPSAPDPWAPKDSVTLELPDGERIGTCIARGRMLRWRGWGRLFHAHHVRPGDTLRFLAVAPATYRVSFRRAPG